MANADDLFASGDIPGARAELINQVRSEPGNIAVRMFLFQLFSLSGEWKKAKSQLETLAKLDPELRMLCVAYSQCIDAEIDREKAFNGETDMPVLSKVDWAEGFSGAVKRFINEEDGADQALLKMLEGLPECKGQADDDVKFDWIMDADPRIGPAIESIISGRYGLIPFTDLETLTISKPQDLRDTVWAKAEFGLRLGAKVSGFIPVRYPGSHNSDDNLVVRGHSTVWQDKNGVELGLGHRTLMMSGGTEKPLLNFEKITFEAS